MNNINNKTNFIFAIIFKYKNNINYKANIN